ncbi:MAG: class I SAM-dependent methyltransferase [Candidatus Helarchaeota archaeon]|nr:class I SAM-dependent methyltransferase [Candidatus Helarchaeota archaeon]
MDLDFLFELHADLPRAGPGNNESTRKAFNMLRDLPPHPQILDIGCGPGMQTIELAKISDGKIIALDIHQPFLDKLRKDARDQGVAEKIETITQSMLEMDFEEKSFDVIWSEGAIFIIGFEKGLEEWRFFLKDGGYLVVSELCWFRDDPPEAIRKFLIEAYPAIKTLRESKKIIEGLGYELIDHFKLPESAWFKYYNPLEKQVAFFREKYEGDVEKNKFLDLTQLEIDMYKEYSKYYGYIFFMMQKT